MRPCFNWRCSLPLPLPSAGTNTNSLKTPPALHPLPVQIVCITTEVPTPSTQSVSTTLCRLVGGWGGPACAEHTLVDMGRPGQKT